MPLLLDAGEPPPITLAETIDTLDASRDDLTDEATLAAFAPLIGALGRNRGFLADLAVQELERRFTGQAANAYGAQVLLLAPPNGRYVLRANFWPASHDAAYRTSGAEAFFYGHAHDHNFSFLTHGYLGPGYASDYFEADPREGARPGDEAHLRFVGRRTLGPGEVMLYRKHRDVHCQLPPEAFSVSLNILATERDQQWRTQYRYDLASGRIAEPLTVAPAEVLATLAVHLGGEAGIALAADCALRHPSPRMRRTALDALLSADAAAAGSYTALAHAAGDPSALVSEEARRALDRLETGSGAMERSLAA